MRNLWEFEKYKLILQGLLLTVVSYVGVPTPQAFAFPSLCHQETTEKQDEVAFATSYEMVKSGSQKTRVRYPDHTAELKLGPPFSSSPGEPDTATCRPRVGQLRESWVSSTGLLLAGSRVGFAQGKSCQLCPFENEQQRGKEKTREREVGGA